MLSEVMLIEDKLTEEFTSFHEKLRILQRFLKQTY